ncbi:WcaF family extracellular polysaccharide biosynthesis acetyltransferase [uncultured Caulobacter sp.]|uniref:WcaF family extracellular polysaccharide biosynthesis acetyltransferase n=1 Tax=uncultured Caulobacter sp. TaxID=158749 RepID=UPI00262FADE5|nr:WcaF family extracellular polysaccharide biosynthesis acetyltransferase [uncultured Caulobacter sp.]
MSSRIPVQSLSSFRIPEGFRGRSSFIVQIWWLTQATLFAWSPQFMYSWRSWLLRRFGARIGKNVLVRPTVRVTYPWKLSIGDNAWVGDFAELYSLGEIYIGPDAVVSQYCYLCTGSHDMTSPAFDIFAKPIKIESEAWVAAGVFVHPGVTIGQGSVVAARSIVRHDTEPYGVYVGEPLRRIRDRRGAAICV